MILFTKEVFVRLKALHMLHINVQTNQSVIGSEIVKTDVWQVYIQGMTPDPSSIHGGMFQTYVNVASKEEAYKLFKELAQQVVDSGEVTELNQKLIDAVLTEE